MTFSFSQRVQLSTLAIVVILATNSLYRESLYAKTMAYTPEIQADASEYSKIMWRVFSDLALFFALAGPFLYQFIWRGDLAMTVYQAIVVCALTVTINFLKLFYHDPRPFWSSDDIQAFWCSTQFGNPSGHSITAFCQSLLLALTYIKQLGGFSQSQGKSAIAVGAAVLFSATVVYSRLFLGVHSLDQVLFGSLIGVWLALTIHYIVRERLTKHLVNVATRQDQRYSQWVLLSLLLLIGTMGCLVSNYYLTDVEIDPKWSDRITQKCGIHVGMDSYSSKSMLDNGQAAIGFGSYFGLVYRAAKFPNLTTAAEQNCKKAFVLLLVTNLLCLPAVFLSVIVQVCLNEMSLMTAMLMGRFIPIFYVTFVLVALSEYVAINLKIFDLKLSMYKRMPEDKEFEVRAMNPQDDLESFDLFPDMTLVRVGTSKKHF